VSHQASGIVMIIVGVVLGLATAGIGIAWAKIMSGIINIWTNWRTLPVLIFFWLGSTGLIIGGIYSLTLPEAHSKHASVGKAGPGIPG
jgi:hypothetical protein